MEVKPKQLASEPVAEDPVADVLRRALGAHADEILKTLELYVVRSGLAYGQAGAEMAMELNAVFHSQDIA